MKARIIKENPNKNLYDCISVGDRITDVGVAYDENGESIGVLISTGCATKTGIHFESNIVIQPQDFDDENVCSMISDKLAYGKYILCTDEGIAEIISEIKSDLASIGIELGEIFLRHIQEPEKLRLTGILRY